MTERSQDAGLEAYLARRSSLSRRYRELDDDVPTPELDARVLAEARRAIGQSGKNRTSSRRWLAPLAVAATVLLTVAVVLEVTQQPVVELAPDQQRSKEQATNLAEPATVSPTPPETGPARNSTRSDSLRRQAPSAPTTIMEGRSPPLANGGFAVDPESDRPLRGPSHAEQTAAPMAGPAASTLPDSRADVPAGMSSPARDEDETVRGDASIEATDRQDADAWLERIEALREAGRTVEADAELERFRQAFPDRALRDAGGSRQ